jgi:N-acetylmuramoyl-L-alanine amidase
MRRLLFLMLGILVCVATADAQNKKIMLDAGHGYTLETKTQWSARASVNDVATIKYSPYTQSYNGQIVYNPDTRCQTEVEATLAIAKLTRSKLLEKFINVDIKMTREENLLPLWLSVNDRYRLSNSLGSDMYLSIHTNASDKGAPQNATIEQLCGDYEGAGVETFFYDDSSNPARVQDQKFADLVNRAVVSTGISSTVRNSGLPKYKDVAVIHYTKARGKCLNEIAFSTNPEERARLNDPIWQAKIADAYVNAIEDYFTWLDATEGGGKLIRKPITPSCDPYELVSGNTGQTNWDVMGRLPINGHFTGCLAMQNGSADIDIHGLRITKGVAGKLSVTISAERPIKSNAGGLVQSGTSFSFSYSPTTWSGCGQELIPVRLEDMTPSTTPNKYKVAIVWTPTIILPTAPATGINGRSSVCSNEQSSYNMTTTNTAMEYRWYSQEGNYLGVTKGNNPIRLVFDKTKTFTVRDALCNTYTKTVTVNTPTVSIASSNGTTLPTLGVTTLTAHANQSVTYKWSSGHTSSGIIYTAPTESTNRNYAVTVTNSTGCTNTASMSLMIVKPDIRPSLNIPTKILTDGGYISIQSLYSTALAVSASGGIAKIGLSTGTSSIQTNLQTVTVGQVPAYGQVSTGMKSIKLPSKNLARGKSWKGYIVLILTTTNESVENNTISVPITINSAKTGLSLERVDVPIAQAEERKKLVDKDLIDSLRISEIVNEEYVLSAFSQKKPNLNTTCNCSITPNGVIVSAGDEVQTRVIISDIQGRAIKTFTLTKGEERTIPIHEFPVGMNIISVQGQGGVKVCKIVRVE